MRVSRFIVAAVFAIAGTRTPAQTPVTNPNTKFSDTAFQGLAEFCGANVPVSTLEAIARRESALHPYALSVNRPHQLAHRNGWNHGTIILGRQPESKEEALAWTKWLLARGVTVSIGLLQVNSEHAKALHLTVEQLFEPCLNVWAGATLLSLAYADIARARGEGLPALNIALSYYNSGTPWLGFRNGYVSQVTRGRDQP